MEFGVLLLLALWLFCIGSLMAGLRDRGWGAVTSTLLAGLLPFVAFVLILVTKRRVPHGSRDDRRSPRR